ncbi:xanthine dehydrogenase accessory protein XdhC [Alcaligenes nematophilus]|uniref:xanthine dehydrogenase accessory protein XdhC n=1 Tax=Alcaligenes TaxID=507 RepID=UPI00202FFB49|nr:MULTISPECIES: xanthine dehydrogenase accessory protein XdhC [Alcaligenes]URW81391.1 xanthine dehydrogenase accessory protein XdhC [Alcaligenes sp. DN25]UTM00928.1 xanthine dehydrogenase accessory protein XdhC [Alcaligenes sp. NLF5-7]WEA66208.1 xanthine dehydrogenase accessory protein XdhC [Alcaligenes faecalis]
MSSWPSLALARVKAGERLVLCSVALAKGSTPRTTGTAMLFSQTEQWLTIGGGHLEWVAAEQARVMLSQSSGPGWSMSRLPLGPSLGQCCGGVVTLLYETLGAEDLGWLEELDSAVRAGQATSRRSQLLSDGNKQVDIQSPSIVDESRLEYDGSQGVWMEELPPPPLTILLFGAGHVGEALVQILGTLPCRVLWIDERPELFPAQVPSNVSLEITDIPDALIEQAPTNSYFLVMTHNHGLDLALCQKILRRPDTAYVGLIGSMTKRRQFERRLQQRGMPESRIQELVCPIGVPGIKGKAPSIIAVAVAAELLTHAYEMGQLSR